MCTVHHCGNPGSHYFEYVQLGFARLVITILGVSVLFFLKIGKNINMTLLGDLRCLDTLSIRKIKT